MSLLPQLLERYQPQGSLVHSLDPRVKILGTVGFIFSNLLISDGDWIGFMLSFCIILIATFLSKISYRHDFPGSLLALPFALTAFTLMFTIKGSPLAAFNLFGWDLIISDTGLIRFISIVLRSWLSIQMAILLTITTRFPDLAHGLLHLRVPRILISVISFMYRYLFVLIEEAQRLIRARNARSAGLQKNDPRSILRRARTAGNMIGQLFLRSYERSDRIYQAMLARGYNGVYLTLSPHIMHDRDWLALTLFAVLLILNHLLIPR